MAFRPYAFIQIEASECGLACLSAAASMLGNRTDLASWRRRFPVSRGLTLKDIHDIGSATGLNVRSVRCELSELKDLKTPAILHVGLNHFVVLQRVNGTQVQVFDPAVGIRKLSIKTISEIFTGVACEITTSPNFQKKPRSPELKITSLFRWTPQLVGGLMQIAIISVLLEVYVIASPYYMQLGIDEAALKGDFELLVSLAIGFGLFAMFNVVATALRAVIIQKVSALLNWDMTAGLFRHLIRLPLPWFHRRRMSDVLNRFQSLDPIKNLIGNGLVSSVFDGVLSIVTGAVLFLYSPKLASIVFANLAVYILMRLFGIPITRNASASALVASIAEQGKRIETLQSIQTIKAMGGEAQRETDWANRFADTVRTGQNSTLANLIFSTIHDSFDAATQIAVIGFGIADVILGHMSTGMLYAFMAYQSQFLMRSSTFFEQIVSWRMLDLYTFRLSDVVLTAPESGIDSAPLGLPEVIGCIELQDVSFRYSPIEPPVVYKTSLVIQPGEFVAIVGPSGCGKSTLLKLLIGLYLPTTGTVNLDGLPLSYWGSNAVRRSMGVVLQDDQLLAGTIADNVCFFADKRDTDLIWSCLELACIAADVKSMAMRADTFVGDLGSSLSGGQKQRILLARALYRRPKILILDEATSHLNVEIEEAINKHLSALNITRIVVAHRQSTIDTADRVVRLNSRSRALVAQ